MLEKTGVPTSEEVESVFPSAERLSRGPVAVIECFQRIPCNPCATGCHRQAIKPFADINDRPEIDDEKCNGCALCLTKCPGLAIMIVDMNWSADRALIKLPYEFRPLPENGQIVAALDREGNPICEAEIIQTLLTPNMNKTPIVSLAVDKSLVKTVRNIKIEKTNLDSSIVCRCNDMTIDELRALIAQGHTSVEELKRIARSGMGPCQGRNCLPIILNELSRALNKPVAELAPGSYRPVVKSIKLGDLADYSGGNHE